MASDSGSSIPDSRPGMPAAEVVAYVKKELDIDDEHLARVITASKSDLPRDAHSGVTLDLSHKFIRELPVEVVALIKDRVERLALSHNPSIAVPMQIVHCDRLRYLNLRWNSLKAFPEAILQLSKLEILDISKNRIVAIPEGIKRMTSLKFLAVARNKITRLPLALGEMASLSKFKFDENPIEFPPPDVLKPATDRGTAAGEAERDKDMCQQVKGFLRRAALRQRLMSSSEEDVSESNVETPRPPRRGLGGRFPVRPSVSGIEGISDLRSGSPPENVPPIPLRSHARVGSQTLGIQLKRPGIAPLNTGGNDISRSRSETVTSTASLRTRRQGFVPSKRNISNNLDTSSVSETASQASTRSSTATIKPSHSRNSSIASTYNGFPAASSGGETSSGAVSPVDGPVNRYNNNRRLPSFAQHSIAKMIQAPPTVAARRLLFMFQELHRPLTRIAYQVKEGSPKRTLLERHLFTVNQQIEDLERLLGRVDSGLEDTPRREATAANNIATACHHSMTAYGLVFKEMKGSMQRVTNIVDPVLLRCLMHQIYSTMVEAKNVCKFLGANIAPPSSKGTPRSSRAWSSKTVTPTQVKPPANKRLRGATILRSTSSNATLRAMPPPVPLNGNTSRTNTMTSTTAATPRSGGDSSSTYSSALPSRSNTLRSHAAEDSDESDQFERIFLKLREACNLATQVLPHCHAEFTVHKDNAETAGHHRTAHIWSHALHKCNAVIRANQALHGRLKVVHLKDPGVRFQRDFWQLCDSFVSTWAELVTEVKDLGQQRIDITSLKQVMKPLQRAIKDISKTISDSPLYHMNLRFGQHQQQPPPTQHFLPPSINTLLAQSHQGPPTSVPATPLAAALGPAAQATLAHTPNALQPPPEYFSGHGPATNGAGIRNMHERIDTVMNPVYHFPGPGAGNGVPPPVAGSRREMNSLREQQISQWETTLQGHGQVVVDECVFRPSIHRANVARH